MTDHPVKIRLQHVGKSYPVRQRTPGGEPVFQALHDVNLSVREGEFLTLVGQSGCGKTTLLELLCGLSLPTTGSITVDGQPVQGPGLDRGIVFQQYALFPWRTALRNVEFGLEAKGVPRRERAERARDHLALVGLQGFEQHYPHELSGGMKQRVAIARSLSYDPGILLMDEPFGALDEQTRESLQRALLRIWQRTGKTIVFITHSIDEAVYLGQRVAVMQPRPGRIETIVEVPLAKQADEHDVRADPQFVALRHEVWKLVRDTGAAPRTAEGAAAGNAARPARLAHLEMA